MNGFGEQGQPTPHCRRCGGKAPAAGQVCGSPVCIAHRAETTAARRYAAQPVPTTGEMLERATAEALRGIEGEKA